MTENILDSSGNIFIDLGFPADEGAVLQKRAELMTDIRKFIKSKDLFKGYTRKDL
jgi:predicted XRE-type DNA-binding protein